MLNIVSNITKVMLLFMLCLGSCIINADAVSEIDRNIEIIFPIDLMQGMIDQTTPEMVKNLKFTNEAEKTKTETAINKFHQEFLQKFMTLVTSSLKQNFTPQELAEWASFETTPLGNKTMNWLKTKYPGILNQAMDAPMQNLFKNLGQ